MKLKKKHSRSESKNLFGIKECRVNLTRLNPKTIRAYLDGGKSTVSSDCENYNFLFKFSRSKWICVKNTSTVRPITTESGTIVISLQSSTQEIIGKEEQPKLEAAENKVQFEAEQPVSAVEIHFKPSQMTISELSIATQKRNLWKMCKSLCDNFKLVDGAIVFAKQSGYAPWPSSLVKFKNKNRTSAVVKYFGFENYFGTVQSKEMVQIDDKTKNAIESLVVFTLKTKSIREFERFEKAVNELQLIMQLAKKE